MTISSKQDLKVYVNIHLFVQIHKDQRVLVVLSLTSRNTGDSSLYYYVVFYIEHLVLQNKKKYSKQI